MTQLLDAVLGQRAQQSGGSGISLTTTAPAAVGSLVVVSVTWWGLATLPTLTVTCPTDPSIVWNTNVMGQINSDYGVGIACGIATSGLITGATLSGTLSATAPEIYVHAHSRLGTDGTVGGSNNASGVATGHWTGGSVTATENGSVVASGVMNAAASTTTPDAGYTEIQDWNNAFHGITMEEVHRTDAAIGTAYTAGGTLASGIGNVVGCEVVYRDGIAAPAVVHEIIRHKSMGKQLSY